MEGLAEVGVPGCWRPILPEALARQALQAVDAIAESIARLLPAGGDASLAAGQAGLALMDAWVFAAERDPQAEARAWRRLDDAFDTVSAAPSTASLYGGFTGVAWAAELIDRVLDPGGEDRNGEVDEVLLRLLAARHLSYSPHDLVMGVTGIGVYALERYPRPLAVECLRRVVQQLRTSAHHDGDGSYWLTPPEGMVDPEQQEQFPSGRVDLGVPHGLGGAIALLGAICGVDVAPATTRSLVQGALGWLTAHSLRTRAGPTYPIWVAPGFEPVPARSAWCYGDPGLAAALLVAARGLDDAALQAKAVALARRSAQRPAEDTGVVDACFCHGTAGLAHVYNRMYQTTGEPALERAAVSWLERTLEYCRTAVDNGPAWVQGSANPRMGPWTGLDIVDGAAGIALVLLAAATSVEPLWDRMFLLSAPHFLPAKPS
jgi:hypothetical protein